MAYYIRLCSINQSNTIVDEIDLNDGTLLAIDEGGLSVSPAISRRRAGRTTGEGAGGCTAGAEPITNPRLEYEGRVITLRLHLYGGPSEIQRTEHRIRSFIQQATDYHRYKRGYRVELRTMLENITAGDTVFGRGTLRWTIIGGDVIPSSDFFGVDWVGQIGREWQLSLDVQPLGLGKWQLSGLQWGTVENDVYGRILTDNAADYLTYTRNQGAMMGTVLNPDNFTISMWVEASAGTNVWNDDAQHWFWSFYGDANNHIFLMKNAANYLSAGRYAQSNNKSVSADCSAYGSATNQHVALTWDGATLSLYRNGSLVGTNTGSAWGTALPDAITIGNAGYSGFPASAWVGDIRHWGTALSATDIAELYSGGMGMSELPYQDRVGIDNLGSTTRNYVQIYNVPGDVPAPCRLPMYVGSQTPIQEIWLGQKVLVGTTHPQFMWEVTDIQAGSSGTAASNVSQGTYWQVGTWTTYGSANAGTISAGTGSLARDDFIGEYRAFARTRDRSTDGTGITYFRVVTQVGTQAEIKGTWGWQNATDSALWSMLDLGTVQFSRALMPRDWIPSQFKVGGEFYLTQSSGATTQFDIDYFQLIPTDAILHIEYGSGFANYVMVDTIDAPRVYLSGGWSTGTIYGIADSYSGVFPYLVPRRTNDFTFVVQGSGAWQASFPADKAQHHANYDLYDTWISLTPAYLHFR